MNVSEMFKQKLKKKNMEGRHKLCFESRKIQRK